MDELSIARGRQVFYTLLLTFITRRGEGLHPAFLRALETYGISRGDAEVLAHITASRYRLDLDPVARSLMPRALEEFYANHGFKVNDVQPDSLQALIAFMARLASDEVRMLELGEANQVLQLRKTQLKTITTHIKPIVEHAARETGLRSLEALLEFLENDKDLLKSLITKQLEAHKPKYA